MKISRVLMELILINSDLYRFLYGDVLAVRDSNLGTQSEMRYLYPII